MKSFVTALLCFVGIGLAFSSAPEKFSRVRINVPDRSTLDRIWSTGMDYEGVTGKVGGFMEFVGGEFELHQLRSHGVSFEIIIDDMAKDSESRLQTGPVNVFGFGYGSMGGYYTFAEVLRQLDTMKLQYPSLITVRDSVGRSQEGRGVWVVKISDNPNINEPGEPEVLYTALHHAREPEGMMSVLYYMWWLLENYGTNPTATYLVNNRQMWFMPVVNPDGYVYNQTTNPNGGGFWRKNRRNNLDGTFGVDPNRNYGPTYMWDSQWAPNGSSTSPGSETYRGPSVWSEPENQTIDNFMRAHVIKACFNYHTYGNYLIYPYGYFARENPDSLVYRDMAYSLTTDNRYTNGTDIQTVSYSTRGVSDDYMYGDTTKPKTWAMTPEVGTTGFWPTVPEIFPLAIGNLSMNIYLSYISGQYATLKRYDIQDAGGSGFLDRGESFNLLATVKNKGASDASNLTYTISSSSPSVQFSTSSAQIASLLSQAEAQVTFAGSVAWNATTGVPVQFYLTATDPQGYLKVDTLRLYVGTPTTAFADSASNGTTNWTTGTGWGVTSNAHTPPSAFTDSPSGNYPSSANNSLTLNSQLNLVGYNYAQLKFWTKWAVEPTWDFATIDVSTNNGSTWTNLRTPLSHKGSARSGSQQPSGSWGYDSYTPFGQQYIEQEADLTPYVNSSIRLRFRMAADGGDQRDGFFVDDIRVHGYTINQSADTVHSLSPE
ncbi:MAG: putative carboxypeptidase [Bacteroidetes bacterium]|nr:putative carboxypeptidase [Bacteroidota bacterium]